MAQVPDLLALCEMTMKRKLCRPDNERLSALVTYHLEGGGSRTRAKLALSAGLAIGLAPETCVSIACGCELIHNASLLHDDIQDRDTHRRGREAAWFHFDANTAMCAGTLLLSAAFESVSQASADVGHLVAHLHQRTTDLISGQTRDLAHKLESLDVGAYIHIATLKSGSLLALPLELVMIAAQQPLAVATAKIAGESFAIAYQIADDLDDLDNDLEKGNCNIVTVLQSSGMRKEQAIINAADMAQAYLTKAKQNAEELPAASGAALIDMCNRLSDSVSPVQKLSRG